MKGSSILTVTTALLVLSLLLAIASSSHASPSDRWSDEDVDNNLVQRVAKRLFNEMTDFERIRRVGLSARHGALSNYLKAQALSARIHNPFGPGRRK